MSCTNAPVAFVAPMPVSVYPPTEDAEETVIDVAPPTGISVIL